jgi:hypothetical protein
MRVLSRHTRPWQEMQRRQRRVSWVLFWRDLIRREEKQDEGGECEVDTARQD